MLLSVALLIIVPSSFLDLVSPVPCDHIIWHRLHTMADTSTDFLSFPEGVDDKGNDDILPLTEVPQKEACPEGFLPALALLIILTVIIFSLLLYRHPKW